MSLPARTGASALAFYRGTLVPAFAGDLFVAAEEGRHLLRLRFDKRDPTRLLSTERLLQDPDSPSAPSRPRTRASSTSPPTARCCGWDRARVALRLLEAD